VPVLRDGFRQDREVDLASSTARSPDPGLGWRHAYPRESLMGRITWLVEIRRDHIDHF
jgi:hypothetical protein